MKPETIEIIAAQPGYFTVYGSVDEKDLAVGEEVIAWRVETYKRGDSNDLFSACMPLTVDGEMISGCIGIQNPDKSVTVFEDSTYKTLSELKQQRYGK